MTTADDNNNKPHDEAGAHDAVHAADTLAWLDGLAGRECDAGGAGCEHAAQGARLRGALVTSEPMNATATAAGWAAIEQRAAHPPVENAPTAANEPRFLSPQRWAWAAVVVIAVGVGAWQWPANVPEPQWRGGGGGAEAVWRVASPKLQAQALAAELRALGATAVVHAAGTDWRVEITAPASATAAVNERLQVLETGLAGDGKAAVVVSAPTP